MPCNRLWAPMSNDVRYSCTSSDNNLALSNLGLNVCPLGCTLPQLFASLLNAVKVVRLQAERQRCCLDIDSNGVRVHVKRSMRCAPLWLHALSYLFTDTPKFFSFRNQPTLLKTMSSSNNPPPSMSPTSLASPGATSRHGRTRWSVSL